MRIPGCLWGWECACKGLHTQQLYPVYHHHPVGFSFITCAAVQAEASFVQLLRINPHSLLVLRNYAQFLLEVVNQDQKVWLPAGQSALKPSRAHCAVTITLPCVALRWHRGCIPWAAGAPMEY